MVWDTSWTAEDGQEQGAPAALRLGSARASKATAYHDLTLFDGPRRPICVAGAAPLRDRLAVCLPGWQGRPGRAPCRPDIVIERQRQEFVLRSALLPGGAMRAPDPWTATARLATDLTGHFVHQADDLFELHAAAVEIDGALILLLGDSMAGKSSLALQLAAHGHRLFTDDRLALRVRAADGAPAAVEAVGYGVAPKARLPLPIDAGNLLVDFLRARRAARTPEDAIYLTLSPAELALRLEEAPVARLVVVERRRHGPSRLSEMSAPALAREVWLRSFAPHLGAQRLLRRIGLLVARLPGHRLRYSSSRDAATILVRGLAAASLGPIVGQPVSTNRGG